MTSEEFRNDSLFLRDQFPHGGVFEMPIIKETDIPLDDSFNRRITRTNKKSTLRGQCQ